MTFVEFINPQRTEQACKLLKFSNMTITEIQYACGFDSQATFNRCFKNFFEYNTAHLPQCRVGKVKKLKIHFLLCRTLQNNPKSCKRIVMKRILNINIK